MRYHGTDIDGVSFDPERLNVRGEDLDHLIRQGSYVGAIFHLFRERRPEREEEARLSAFLCRAATLVSANHPVAALVRGAIGARASVPKAMLAGYMAELDGLLTRAREQAPLHSLGFDAEEEEALFCVAIAPALLRLAADPEAGRPPLPATDEYAPLVFECATARAPASAAERAIFEALMVAFHAGFGFFAPTTQLPRMAIATGVTLPVAIAAGYAASGPAHVGACEEAMRVLGALGVAAVPERTPAIEALVQQVREKRRVLPGFGHPLLERDPRPPTLRELAHSVGYASPFLEAYDVLAATARTELGLQPNIDSIAAALLFTMGVPASCGSALFLACRTAAMAAHALEKRRAHPAFGFKSGTARSKLREIPKDEFKFPIT